MNELNKKRKYSFIDDAVSFCLDMSGLFGFGLVTHGVYLVYHPAAYIFAGAVILWASLTLQMRGRGR